MENLPAKNENTAQGIVLAVKPNDIFLVSDVFAQAQRGAELLAASDLVPQQYQKNMPNCFIALATAHLLDIDVFAYMQNSYVVHGRPGIEAKLKIAMINTRGPFKGPIQWRMEGEGNSRRCTAYAVHGETGELCEATITWTMVVAEKWNQKPGSKWNTLPELMFRYRSASFLGNLYCPEVTMGMKTIEELEDIDMHPTANGTYAAANITEKVKKKEKPKKKKTAADLAKENEAQTQEEEIPEPSIDTALETAGIEKAAAKAKATAAAAKKKTSPPQQQEEPPPVDEPAIEDEPVSDDSFGWV